MKELTGLTLLTIPWGITLLGLGVALLLVDGVVPLVGEVLFLVTLLLVLRLLTMLA